MSPFSVIVTPSSIAFTAISGKPFNITADHPSFSQIKELVKRYGTEPENADLIRAEMDKLAEPAAAITIAGKGRVIVQDGVILFNGEEIHNAVTERILWGLSEGFGMDSYIAFLDNLMDNPSRRAVTELYGFLEKHKMGISDDGHIIAYKKVRENYTDIFTGEFDNSPGQVLDMTRNAVDDNCERTCSYGYHFCAFDYLGSFGCSPGNRVVIVRVNPRDVVSIPKDFNDAKARCCHYEVIGEYQGSDLENVLANRPVWTETSLNEQFKWGDEDEYEEEYEDAEEEEEEYDDDDDCSSDDSAVGNGIVFGTAGQVPQKVEITPVANILASFRTENAPRRAGRYIIKVEYGEKITMLGGVIDVAKVIWDDGETTYVTTNEENDLLDSLREQAELGHKARVSVK